LARRFVLANASRAKHVRVTACTTISKLHWK